MQKRAWLVVTMIACASLVLASLSFLLPTFSGANFLQVHIRAGVAVVIATLCAGASIWFMSGLKSFKSGLRLAYRLLAAGIILLGVALMQLPIIGLYDLWNAWWSNSGALIVPFMVAAALIYAGVRQFAKLLNVKTRIMSPWFVLAVNVAFMTISAIAVHYLALHPFEGIEIFTATVAWAVSTLFFSVLVTRRIQYALGPQYQNALRSLKTALIFFTIAGIHEYTVNFFLGFDSPYLLYGITMWPFLVAGILLTEASRNFYLLTAQASIEVAAPTQGVVAPVRDQDYVDSIIAVATLASRPQDIDPLLDSLRAITAHYGTQLALTNPEKQSLIGVYRSIEDYLVTNEPLRSFSKEEVRKHATQAFRLQLIRW